MCCLEATWFYCHFSLVFWSCLCISVSANVDSEAQNQQSWIPPGSCWAEHDMVQQPTTDPCAFPFPLFNCKQNINIFTGVSVETLIVGMCFEWQSLLLYSLLFTIIFFKEDNCLRSLSEGQTCGSFPPTHCLHWWTVNSIRNIT